MDLKIPKQWLFPSSLEEAAKVQRILAGRVFCDDQLPEIKKIAGVDVSNNLRDPENIVYSAIVSLDLLRLKAFENASSKTKALFPYVPGFLAFREVPAILEAYSKLNIKPDLIVVDGHGISHPRKLGIASHLGVLLDCPSIGIAKKLLVGKLDRELGLEAGDSAAIIWQGKQIGLALRTKRKVNPIYISIGHRISLPTAVELVKRFLKGYRLPEPTRQAHLFANAYRRNCLVQDVNPN